MDSAWPKRKSRCLLTDPWVQQFRACSKKSHRIDVRRDCIVAQRSDQLSLVLYQHGGASYLQVLTNETNYFSAELNLVQAQLNERLALVQLYQSLGGGWQQ